MSCEIVDRERPGQTWPAVVDGQPIGGGGDFGQARAGVIEGGEGLALGLGADTDDLARGRDEGGDPMVTGKGGADHETAGCS